MADQTNIGAEGSAPAAVPQKTEENRVPQARFNEVNAARLKAETELEAFKKGQQAAEAKRLEDQQEWQKLAEKRGAEIERLKELEDQLTGITGTLDSLLKAQLADLTDDAKAMVPKALSQQQQLDWIAENRARLTKPTAPNFDAGARGDSTKTTRQLTSGEQKAARAANMSDPEYLEAVLSMERASAQAANVSFKERPAKEE